TYIAGINGVTASGAVPVYINANGQLGTVTSSQRFKYDIQDMGIRSDKLMNLRPVLFRYKEAAEDGTHPLQYGLIAEEVAKVYPDLVQYDKQGKPFTVYYHLLTPMLLNELQKEHRQNQAQQKEIAGLKSELTALKQSQQQQRAALAKLTALVEASQNKAQSHQAVAMQH
ncbi:MAG TPA: tail fiber domain-containing protein, partial [Chthonomonadaceae bacterium]|nr:tail fiber domain-containing protein [Chthonomonadaceae bacterium]